MHAVYNANYNLCKVVVDVLFCYFYAHCSGRLLFTKSLVHFMFLYVMSCKMLILSLLTTVMFRLALLEGETNVSSKSLFIIQSYS